MRREEILKMADMKHNSRNVDEVQISTHKSKVGDSGIVIRIRSDVAKFHKYDRWCYAYIPSIRRLYVFTTEMRIKNYAVKHNHTGSKNWIEVRNPELLRAMEEAGGRVSGKFTLDNECGMPYIEIKKKEYK